MISSIPFLVDFTCETNCQIFSVVNKRLFLKGYRGEKIIQELLKKGNFV